MLWGRNKPLNQPPGYGRVGYQHDAKVSGGESEKAAQRALSHSQLERKHATQRHGGRAVVVD